MISNIITAITAQPGRWIKAGIAATVVLTIFMEGIARIVLGGPLKPAGLICQALGWDSSMLWAGEVIHYALGFIFFPIGYVAALAVTKKQGGVVTGMIWGVILWLGAATVMMALAGQPLFFGFGKTMVASLVAHIAYGAVLGVLFGSAPLRTAQ